MTNDNAIGGTVAVVAVSGGSLKHSLRSATKAKKDAVVASTSSSLEEESVLVHEEEKMMHLEQHDEEVTSVESIEDDDVERTMLTVALMKSVVDQQHGETGAANGNNNDDSTAKASDDSLKHRLRKRRRRSGQDLERLERCQSTGEGGLKKAEKVVATAASLRSTKAIPDRNSSGGLVTSSSSTQPLPSISENIFVPNPLSKPIPPFIPGNNSKLKQVEKPAVSSSDAMNASDDFPGNQGPCPLTAFSEIDPAFVSVEEITMPAVLSDRKVNFNTASHKKTLLGSSTTALTTRMRGFSIDLDLGLEFPDDSSASVGGVNSEIHSAGGRNRAFSFECFAFGINADEPLPPLDQSASNANVGYGGAANTIDLPMILEHHRPRGDSIIFDPASFQDGGIHEQLALERAKVGAPKAPSRRSTGPAPAPPRSISSVVSTTAKASSSSLPHSHPNASSSLSSSMANGSTTLCLELLNKDGRIGIYLPEARRARIARFHAKRSKRIWRKRIKYDCRKKLADSRPRIKGRFVKRSDMDED